MKIIPSHVLSLQEMRDLVAGAKSMDLDPAPHSDARKVIADTLAAHGYARLRKPDKGTVLACLRMTTGLSPVQVRRLAAQWVRTGALEDRRGPPAAAFLRTYTDADAELLAETDDLHDYRSAFTMQGICKRHFEVFGDRRYERLAGISCAHIYNLRRRKAYLRTVRVVQPTRPVRAPAIGARRAPRANGLPGHLRIDAVHQGDRIDEWGSITAKGVFYLNVVDITTQWQAVAAVPALSCRFVQPMLEELLTHTFPFVVRGLHSDNGSEFVNRETAALLERLNIEFTRSRPRRSNDNALAESKNASVVRREFGRGYIPTKFHRRINRYTTGALQEYLNFHHPCCFARERTDARGKVRRVYRPQDVMTPFEKLCSLPDAASHLRPGVTMADLQETAMRITDNESARLLKKERTKLFRPILRDLKKAA